LAEIRRRPSYLVADFKPGWLAVRTSLADAPPIPKDADRIKSVSFP